MRNTGTPAHSWRGGCQATKTIEPATAAAIWEILVEECGARDTADQRYSFVHYLGMPAFGGHEYRFQGSLGFGGKFYNDHFKWRVGCYREDETPERTAMIRRANEWLAELRQTYLAGRE